jgi:hypothetical protein
MYTKVKGMAQLWMPWFIVLTAHYSYEQAHVENVVSVHDTLRGGVNGLLTDDMPEYYRAIDMRCV